MRFCPQHTLVSRLAPYLLRFARKSFLTLDLLLAMQIHIGQQAPNLTEIRWVLVKSNCGKITSCFKWYPWRWECTFSKFSALCQECTMTWIMKMNNANEMQYTICTSVTVCLLRLLAFGNYRQDCLKSRPTVALNWNRGQQDMGPNCNGATLSHQKRNNNEDS